MNGLRMRWPERVFLALVVVAVFAVPFLGGRLALYNMTIIALYGIVVISLNLLLGLAGQASFAQTTFMAIGGYGVGILSTRYGVNPWAAIGIALVVSVALAFLIGKALLRLRGHYLSMATVALALGTASFANASSITNGGWGITGIPALTIGSFSFRTPINFYILAWTCCGLSLLAYVLLANSYVGRAWRALSTRQDIAATLGIDVPRYKLVALLIAAVMATVAGALYVAYTRFVGPDLYDIAVVINLMFMLFVGGVRSTAGPIAGTAFVILVPQMVAGFERYQNLAFFILLLLVILIWPAGLFGHVRNARKLRQVVVGWFRSERAEPARGAGAHG